ncbi:riboflavin biosynthesis protein PYRD, chloroplastic [Humulus lupulus]|uniref:riboflavin biosynthesis protein PYRD, chloroplastic n=1 Tax=Humulus lupulus TaxID=3486 RepID=UPI002B4092EF|nr:riboflavin biosynthesis protein PYRD, chloroplastic [Humulus lupulus]
MQAQRLSLPIATLSPPLSSNYPLLPITKLFLSKSNFPSGFCNSLIFKTISLSPTTLPKLMSGVSAQQGYDDGDGDYNYDDGFYMRKCVEIARKAIGCTSPNPLVGCVIVKDGKIVGQGFHPKAGQPHAEVFALRDAGNLADNATAYVSLEPCNHFGRTPPCTEALIKAKVKRVVIGMVDPNPIVASKGVERLRNAGIEVTVGIEEELCKSLNEPFVHLMLTRKPFVTLRYSLSVNGQIVDQLGEGSTESSGYYSQLLQEYDAVIVLSASIADKFSIPQSQEPGANQPLWIVAATNNYSSLNKISDLPIEAATKVIVFSNQEIVEPKIVQRGIETVVLDQISLNAILEYSKRQGFCSVLLDLRGSVDDIKELLKDGIEQNMLQKVVIEVLPQWVESGGKNSCVALSSLDKRLDIKKLKPKMSGKSVLLEGYF